jgi:hypothetical protein
MTLFLPIIAGAIFDQKIHQSAMFWRPTFRKGGRLLYIQASEWIGFLY